MQDDYRYGFDDKFVDRAWSNMQQMLDEEMPPEQQPERKAWMWWLTGGLLLLGLFVAGIYYYNIQPQASPDAHTITSEAPVASKPAQSSIDTDIPAEAAASVPSSNSDGQAALNNEQTPEPSVATETVGSQPDYDIPNTPLVSTESAQKQPLKEQAVLPLSTDEKTEQDALAQSTDTKEILNRPSIQALSPLSTNFSPLPDLANSADVENPISPVQQKRYLKFGVEGSVYSQGVEKLHGIGAAAVVELHKGHKRAYFKSAVGYQLFQPELVEREKSLEFNNTALMPAPAQAGDPPAPDIITTRSSITELRYAYLMIAAGYKLNDRFSVEAGIMPAQLLSSTLTETWTLTPAQSADEDAGSTPFVSRISDDQVEVNNRQFSLIGGLSYQVNPSLNLNLQYQYAISDLLPQAQNEAYLRGARLSVCYYIR